jgi:cell division protein FtsW (lipid II flippase)
MAKYAAIYFLIGVLIAALRRDGRIGWANAGLMLAACAVVVAPNVVWNMSHQLTTFAHTADNIGWVEKANPLAGLSAARASEFLLSQFAVAGPLIFAALLVALRRLPLQAAFVIPPLAIVTLQALLGTAQANWAVAAYFAGVPLAISLLQNHPRWLVASFVINGVVSILLPLTVIFTSLTWNGVPLLDRQLGRADMSRQIIALAHQNGDLPILADSRDVLADLFYTGQSEGLTYYAPRPKARAENHYEQRYPLPANQSGLILWVTSAAPNCALQSYPLKAEGGAYRKKHLAAYLVPAECARAQQ